MLTTALQSSNCYIITSAMNRSVLFLCPYGGAKSVMAMAYFNRLAEARALPYTGVAAAAEEPYEAVPEPVVASLRREGIDVHAFRPRRVADDDIAQAARVISIGCEEDVERSDVERWDDVPKVSEDLEGAAAAIRRHVEALVAELDGER